VRDTQYRRFSQDPSLLLCAVPFVFGNWRKDKSVGRNKKVEKDEEEELRVVNKKDTKDKPRGATCDN